MESGGGLLLLGVEVDRAEDVDDQAESRGIHVADGADADDIDKVNVEADAHDHGQNHCDGSSLVIDALPEEAQQNRNRYNGAKGVGADLEGRCDVGNDNCDQGDQRCTAGNDDTADTEQGLVAQAGLHGTDNVIGDGGGEQQEEGVAGGDEQGENDRDDHAAQADGHIGGDQAGNEQGAVGHIGEDLVDPPGAE